MGEAGEKVAREGVEAFEEGAERAAKGGAEALEEGMQQGLRRGADAAGEGTQRLARQGADALDDVSSMHHAPNLKKVPEPPCPLRCFAAGTLVATSEGLVPIEQVQVGDQIYAYDDATGEEHLAEVVALQICSPPTSSTQMASTSRGTRSWKNPDHVKATNLQRRTLRVIKRALGAKG